MSVTSLKAVEELNQSECHPVEFKVLILPDDIEDADPQLKRAKAMGLVLSQDHKEREQMGNMYGTLVAVGGNAFTDWQEPIPRVGQRVLFARYAGNQVQGKDGKTYRIAQDKDIAAVLG